MILAPDDRFLVFFVFDDPIFLLFFLQYIGSFSVTGADPNERAENVQKQLEQMRVSISRHVGQSGNCQLLVGIR